MTFVQLKRAGLALKRNCLIQFCLLLYPSRSLSVWVCCELVVHEFSSPFTSLLSLFCHTASSSDSIESIVNATGLEGLHDRLHRNFLPCPVYPLFLAERALFHWWRVKNGSFPTLAWYGFRPFSRVVCWYTYQGARRSRQESQEHRPFVALANLTRVRSNGHGRNPLLKISYSSKSTISQLRLKMKLTLRVVERADVSKFFWKVRPESENTDAFVNSSAENQMHGNVRLSHLLSKWRNVPLTERVQNNVYSKFW